MSHQFNKKELQLIARLQNLKQQINPSKAVFERMLDSIPSKPVTNYNHPRYYFSMYRYAIPAFLLIAIVTVGGYVFMQGKVNSPSQTETAAKNQDIPNQVVTADNADSTLQQTDIAISQSNDQLDQDLKSLDQTNQGEEDLNNL